MGKKYIIEISEDKIADFVGSTHFLMPYMIAGHIGHHDTGLPIKPYTEPNIEQVNREKDALYDEARARGYEEGKARGYQEGLFDAWEAARKVTQVRKYGGYGDCLEEVFGRHRVPWDVFDYSASEAIEKIRQYEQEKEEQIQVGDEVKDGNDIGIVTSVPEPDNNVYVMWKDGSSGPHNTRDFRKTGRHFPEIAEVLQKMKEEET